MFWLGFALGLALGIAGCWAAYKYGRKVELAAKRKAEGLLDEVRKHI